MVLAIMDDSSDASSSSPHRYPDWVMLDRRIHLDGYPEDDHFHATSACAMSSEGETVRVSLCAVPPPAASRLFVSWTRSREADDRDQPSFQFMAAHGSSILLRLRRDRHDPDLFVYTARSTGPSLLWLLPRFGSMSHTYSFYEIYYTRLYGMSSLEDVGLLCDGDGGFVVAELVIRRCQHNDDTPLKAGLCVFRSGNPNNNWKARRLWIHHKKGQGNELLWWSWSTHEVVALRDSLCYVDYSRGILFLDVLSRSPEIRYVRLPMNIPMCDLENYSCHTNVSERSRSLYVADGGRTMKFVDVVSGATASALFTINVWRLRREGQSMMWEKESGMGDANLWAQPGYGGLPRVVPIFPRASVEQPNFIYFVMGNGRQIDDEGDTWVILVDMLNKTLRSSFRYINDSVTNCAFIPCEFSKYLQIHKPETS